MKYVSEHSGWYGLQDTDVVRFLTFFSSPLDAAFELIMGNVCNVHVIPTSLFLRIGESIIKVFGILRVDGEGSHISEVLAFGNFFIGYFQRILSAAFLDKKRVDIAASQSATLGAISWLCHRFALGCR